MMSNSKYILSNNYFDILHRHMSDSSLGALLESKTEFHNKHFVMHMLDVHLSTSVENILQQKMFS